MQGAARRRAAATAWHSTNPSGLRAGPPTPCCKGRNRGCWEPRGRVHCRNTGAMLSRRICRAWPQSDRASSVSILKRPGVKRVRRILVLAVVLASAVYFVPVPTLILVACGLIDVGRHKKIRYELIEKYFMGNGLGTWLLSPINLLADLFSYSNKGKYKLEDLPAGHRGEIESCVRAFVENGDLIKDHIARTIGQNKRCMLTFKWYKAVQDTQLRIPAFERNHRYIKTIAVSVFNTRERTSWHFGPLRFTFRVLCNLEPIDKRCGPRQVLPVHGYRSSQLFAKGVRFRRRRCKRDLGFVQAAVL